MSQVSGRGSTMTTNQHCSDTVDGHRTSNRDASRNGRVGSGGGQHSVHRDTSRRHPVVSGGHRRPSKTRRAAFLLAVATIDKCLNNASMYAFQCTMRSDERYWEGLG